MPLEDLEADGYQVSRTPEGMAPGDSIYGYGKQWILMPGIGLGEEEIVAEARNHKKIYDKLEQAQDYFATQYTNWPTMTNVQKDTAMRNSMRAMTNLIRHVRNDLSSEGS
jgi:hypothetical protein